MIFAILFFSAIVLYCISGFISNVLNIIKFFDDLKEKQEKPAHTCHCKKKLEE